MAANEYVFSIRGIVRGYQLFPSQGPLKEFFLDDSDGIETPIRLKGVNLPMRDGHDVEVFFVRPDGDGADIPLLACNYSIQQVEEILESTKTGDGKNLPGCGLGIGGILIAVFLIGIGFGPALLIGGGRLVPLQEGSRRQADRAFHAPPPPPSDAGGIYSQDLWRRDQFRPAARRPMRA